MLLCWSIKNTRVCGIWQLARTRRLSTVVYLLTLVLRLLQAPERKFLLPCDVVAVQFSSLYPHLLAVGLANGNIRVYNMSEASSDPLLDSSGNDPASKHTQPVWDLAWSTMQHAGQSSGEGLVSIATDGHVLFWDLQKGMEPLSLMKVKRVHGDVKPAAEIADSSTSAKRKQQQCVPVM